MDAMKKRLALLLRHKEEGMVSMAKGWLEREVAQEGAINKAGTFRYTINLTTVFISKAES